MSIFFKIVLLVLFSALILFVTKYFLKHKKILDVSKAAWARNKVGIIGAIEEIGEERSNALLLFLEDRNPTDKLTINISSSILSPWSGRSIEINTKDEVAVRLHASAFEDYERRSELLVPKIKLKNGKSQYMWSPDRYLSKSRKLRSYFSELNQPDQSEALYRIIEKAIKINGGLSWVQNAEFPNCSICKKRMKFILQLSGLHFSKNKKYDIHESEIYVFGCTKHTDEIKPVIQFY